jgi:hypothetical protein
LSIVTDSEVRTESVATPARPLVARPDDSLCARLALYPEATAARALLLLSSAPMTRRPEVI